MAYKINDNCISCGSCEPECPVEAISEGDDHYEIDASICVECKGHFDEPQCIANCPTHDEDDPVFEKA